MDKILVFHSNQPCLDIQGNETGVHRDRNPDASWSQLRVTNIKIAKKIEVTPELKQILLEDLAWVYGQDSIKFREKLKEFKFI